MITLQIDPGPVAHLAFGRGGRLYASARRGHRVWWWDGGTTNSFLLAWAGRVSSLAASAASPTLAIGTERAGAGRGVILRAADGTPGLQSLREAAEGSRPAGPLHFAGDRLIAAEWGWPSGHGRLAEYGPDGRRKVLIDRLPRELSVYDLAHDGRLLAVADQQSRVRVYDTAEGTRAESNPFTRTLNVFSALLGGFLIGGPAPRGGQAEVATRTVRVRCLRFSPCGGWLAAATGHGTTVRRLEVDWAAGRVEFKDQLELKGHRKLVGALAFTPDGGRLITAGYDGVARVWALPSGRELAGYDLGVGKLHALAVAPDGLRAAAGGEDGRVVVWDAED